MPTSSHAPRSRPARPAPPRHSSPAIPSLTLWAEAPKTPPRQAPAEARQPGNPLDDVGGVATKARPEREPGARHDLELEARDPDAEDGEHGHHGGAQPCGHQACIGLRPRPP